MKSFMFLLAFLVLAVVPTSALMGLSFTSNGLNINGSVVIDTTSGAISVDRTFSPSLYCIPLQGFESDKNMFALELINSNSSANFYKIGSSSSQAITFDVDVNDFVFATTTFFNEDGVEKFLFFFVRGNGGGDWTNHAYVIAVHVDFASPSSPSTHYKYSIESSAQYGFSPDNTGSMSVDPITRIMWVQGFDNLSLDYQYPLYGYNVTNGHLIHVTGSDFYQQGYFYVYNGIAYIVDSSSIDSYNVMTNSYGSSVTLCAGTHVGGFDTCAFEGLTAYCVTHCSGSSQLYTVNLSTMTATYVTNPLLGKITSLRA
jgi:hypothetical protein